MVDCKPFQRRFIKSEKELYSMLLFYRPFGLHIYTTENGCPYYSTAELEDYYITSILGNMDKDMFWTLWQQDLRTLAIWNQAEKCHCGESLRHSDLHHAIVTRQDVRGIKDPLEKGKIIHHSFNVMMVCHGHHEKETRQQSWDYLCQIYGKDEIEKYRRRYLPARNMGTIVISTSKGLMTHEEAVQEGFGGSLIAFFY